MLVIGGAEPATAIPLIAGWNLVGYNTRTARATADCMSSIEGKYISVWGYDPVQGWLWYIADTPFGSNLGQMRSGMGYWINAKEDCTWDIGR